MLASFPVSMLNQKPSDLGIPNRLKLDPSRSRRRISRSDLDFDCRFSSILKLELKLVVRTYCVGHSQLIQPSPARKRSFGCSCVVNKI